MGIYSQLVEKKDSIKSSSRQHSRQLEKTSPPKKSTTREIEQSPSLDRPKAFYITKKQTHELDKLVKLMRKKASGKTTVKIDRSTIVRLVLDKANLDEEKTADELIDILAEQLSDYFD